ncbi:uncharacterized protein LOC141698153 [Apium graveolens]|uniref:uncharacterized protein LOC141698153 n=1 Tax=Apium graveolens TaxID=4045 RepID=UPI003D79D47D
MSDECVCVNYVICFQYIFYFCSKKVYSEATSMDSDVVEISPPQQRVTRSSKSKAPIIHVNKVNSEGTSMDLDVVEISPPQRVTRSSKSKALKITEVTNQEIIDVDMDGKHGNMNIKGKAVNKYNGKRAARVDTMVSHKLSLA